MVVRERVEQHRDGLTRAERRVAEVVLADPEAVAFGTVAGLAERAGVGAATVVRLAERLDYRGFVALQADVRAELTGRLRLASERIRRSPGDDVIAATLSTELANLRETLERVDRAAFATAVERLTDRRARVVVAPGGASVGVARQLADELAVLRPGVALTEGTPVALASRLADLGPPDTIVVVDLRRLDRAVLDAVANAAGAGCAVVAITDSLLSPLAGIASATLVVAAEGAGPFDSHLGVLAVVNALVAAAAAALRRSATARIDRVEAAWRATGAVVEP